MDPNIFRDSRQTDVVDKEQVLPVIYLQNVVV